MNAFRLSVFIGCLHSHICSLVLVVLVITSHTLQQISGCSIGASFFLMCSYVSFPGDAGLTINVLFMLLLHNVLGLSLQYSAHSFCDLFCPMPAVLLLSVCVHVCLSHSQIEITFRMASSATTTFSTLVWLNVACHSRVRDVSWFLWCTFHYHLPPPPSSLHWCG